MSAPRQRNSMRHLVRIALLRSFAQSAKIGNPTEIAEGIQASDYSPNSLKVQVAQVRNDILQEMGVNLPFRPKGRLSAEKIAQIEQRIRLPQFKKKAAQMLKEAEQV